MSTNNNDPPGKRCRPNTRRYKNRLMIRDPIGTSKTFRQFYQSGGRDYEQYRLWLQTLTKSEQSSASSSTPSVDLDKIKIEYVKKSINHFKEK